MYSTGRYNLRMVTCKGMISNACNITDIFPLPVLKVVHYVRVRQHISSLTSSISGLIYPVSPMKRTGPRSGRHIDYDPKKPLLLRTAHNEHSGTCFRAHRAVGAAPLRCMAAQVPTLLLPHHRKLRQRDIYNVDEMRLDPTANFAAEGGCHAI